MAYDCNCPFPVVVMVDASDRWVCHRLDFEVLKCLAQHPDIPAVLVLNKVLLHSHQVFFTQAETQLRLAFLCPIYSITQ